MKKEVSVTARMCVAIAAAVFAFTCGEANAAELAGTSRLAAEFQATAESDLLVLGPVDLVEPSKSRVQILGQWVTISDRQMTQPLEGLVGHVLAVYGSLNAEGAFEVSSVHEQTSTDYVAGATRLYLKGSVAALDNLHATARIGSLSVSYSNALHTLARTTYQ